MCRNIKTLFDFEPPATDEEIQAASLQFVRKLSGFNKPSQANPGRLPAGGRRRDGRREGSDPFADNVGGARDRQVEAARARERNRKRFNRA